MIKLLVVDDHELVRIGIERLLADAEDIEVVGEAESGEDAIKLSREIVPDVVLMDINMPGIGGIEATRKLLQHNPEIKVLIVTVFEEEPFPSRLLQIGASGYLTKGANVDELLTAIRTVSVGKRYINPKIAQKLALQSLNTESGESLIDELSDRELEVMVMITKGIKVAEIAEKLHISPKTVNSYRYRLFEKLDINNDVEMTYLAIRHGLIKIEQIMETDLGSNTSMADADDASAEVLGDSSESVEHKGSSSSQD